MDLTKLTKAQLLTKCQEVGINVSKNTNKMDIINILQDNTLNTKENTQSSIDIQNTPGIEYLKTITNNSIDLILTDPPYIISKDSGMNEYYNNVKFNEEHNIKC